MPKHPKAQRIPVTWAGIVSLSVTLDSEPSQPGLLMLPWGYHLLWRGATGSPHRHGFSGLRSAVQEFDGKLLLPCSPTAATGKWYCVNFKAASDMAWKLWWPYSSVFPGHFDVLFFPPGIIRSNAHIFFVRFFFFFCYGPFKKSLLNSLQYCFCSMFWCFGCEACGIFARQPVMEPAPPAVET